MIVSIQKITVSQHNSGRLILLQILLMVYTQSIILNLTGFFISNAYTRTYVICHSERSEESQSHEEKKTLFLAQRLRFAQHDNKKSVKLSIIFYSKFCKCL